MKWQGETLEQAVERWRAGYRRYAYLPTQMHDGQWVWLEYFWSRRNGRGTWRNGLTLQGCAEPTYERPPPPTPSMVARIKALSKETET